MLPFSQRADDRAPGGFAGLSVSLRNALMTALQVMTPGVQLDGAWLHKDKARYAAAYFPNALIVKPGGA